MKKTILIGAALAGVTSFASLTDGVVYQDQFTGDTLNAVWSGDDGVLTLSTTSQNLAISGSATCVATNNTVEGDISALACDTVQFDITATAGANPTDAATDCQIAIATGATDTSGNVTFWVCSAGDSGAEWTQTTYTAAADTSVTVSLAFTHGATTNCTVTLSADGTTTFTETYTPILTDATAVGSLEFEGETTLDNIALSVTTQEFDGITVAGADSDALSGISADYSMLIAMGITNMTSSSGLTETQAQQLVAGLKTAEAVATFGATEMTAAGDTVTVKIPCDYDVGQNYQIALTDGSGTTLTTVDGTSVTAGAATDGSRTLKFSIPSDVSSKVVCFKIQACAGAAANATEAATE